MPRIARIVIPNYQYHITERGITNETYLVTTWIKRNIYRTLMYIVIRKW
jgi:hypothetical protein